MIKLKHPKTTIIGVLFIVAGAVKLLGIGVEPMHWDFAGIATTATQFLIGAGFIATADGKTTE